MKLSKILLSLAIAALTLPAAAASYHYESVPGDITGTRIYTLSNGLRVYMSVNKEKPRVTVYIAVRTGSRNDPAETTGLAHYLEHLMFKGTQRYGTSDLAKEKPYLDDIRSRYEEYRKETDPEVRKRLYHGIDSVSQLAAQYNIPNEYDKLMAQMGSEGSNAYTSNDVTCYQENIPSNEIENWAKVQADRFQNMVIRGFHTELEAVYEEKNISMAKDNAKLYDALSALLFPTHPYGTQTTIGTQDHLKNPSIVNIENYFHQYYCPNNVAICMAGDFDFESTIAIIDKYFGTWKPNAGLTRPEFAPLKPLASVKDSVVYGDEAPFLGMGWRFDAARSAQCDTLGVVSSILYNRNAGLLDLNLNQKMKVLYAQAGQGEMCDYSSLQVYAYPKEGQTLDDVRQLILAEVAKLRRGEFSDQLLSSVISNEKRQWNEAAESNRYRVSMMVDAFINGKKWDDMAHFIDRIKGITKQQVIDFANKYLRDDNYVYVYKQVGEDKTLKKIEKPAITPIPANANKMSDFVREVVNTQVEPIQPRFVDFKTDMSTLSTKKGIPVLYKQNTENGIFTLVYLYDFGTEADKRMGMAMDYLDYLGTDKMTNAEFKQQMYALACDYSFSAQSSRCYITLHGLSENMGKAIALVENLMSNAKVDQKVYYDNVSNILKDRADSKSNQRQNFIRLQAYGMFGPYNVSRNILSEAELKGTNPQVFVDLVKKLSTYQHTILYYGPATERQFVADVEKFHKTAKTLLPVPANKDYMEELTPRNEVYIAPYDAKNIYMMQYHNEGRPFSPDHAPVIALFNAYFGGGMNAIVFQELRETRGLAYSAGAYYAQPSRKGHSEYASTSIITQNDKMMDCINEFNRLLDTIPQSQAGLDLAKASLRKSLASDRTTKMDILWLYLYYKRLGINEDLNEKIYNELPKLSLQDIVNFEKETMANKPYRYIILGNEKELDMKSLEKVGTIHRLTTEEIFGY